MICPACSNELTPIVVGTITLDVCKQYCGGVWFDAGEFQLYDEIKEAVPLDILRPIRNQDVAIDRNKPRPCPRCENTKLHKRFYDAAYELQIDQCPKCSGIFLDPGELQNIREENKGVLERQEVIDDYMNGVQALKPTDPHAKGLRAVLGLIFK